MPKSSRPRKAYRPTFKPAPPPPQLPMTQSLFDEFDMQLMVCMQGLWKGSPQRAVSVIHHSNNWHADMAAKLINLVNTAQHHEGRPDVRITGSVSIIQRWLDSFVAAGEFWARPHDLMTVGGAITAAREYLAQADIGRLGEALQILKTFESLEARNAISPADGRSPANNTQARSPAQANDAQPNQDRPAPRHARVPQGPGSASVRLDTWQAEAKQTAQPAL